MNSIRKDEKGITILVLVITIIVLMLLATFTLSFSLGEDGVFTKARRINFLDEISELQKELTEQEVIARANGQDNSAIKTGLEESLSNWQDENQNYEDIEFEIVLNSQQDTFVLTYAGGATEEQESWLRTVSFPGVPEE